MNGLDFKADSHTYTLDGANVPSVTGIIKEVIGTDYHGATDWHMQRGSIIHECAAIMAEGKRFADVDPRIAGHVEQLANWYDKRGAEIVTVECPVAVRGPIPYAGTLDLLARIDGKMILADWKCTHSPWDQWQLGAYAMAFESVRSDDFDGIESPKLGMILELTGKGGLPKEHGGIKLRQAINEWRSILNVYAMKQREGIA